MTNQANEREIRATGGYFNVVGEVMVDSKTFGLNTQGKNNTNWMQNVFNPKIECKNGQSMYMRFSSGYDAVKGKTVYARSKTETNLEIPFGDRLNQNMIDLVDEKSFIKVGYEKKIAKNEDGTEYKAWVYKEFLDVYDAITFLQQVMPLATKQKVQIRGRVRFSTYKGEVQRNYDIQSIYLLNGNEEEGKEAETKLSFTQNVLVKKDSVDKTKIETEGLLTVNSLVMVKEKKEFKTIPVKFIMKTSELTDEKKAILTRIADRYFNIDEDKVRRINLDCVFESGYVQGNIKEEDLPQEAREMIEDGIYSLEEVMKIYASKDRVDNLVIIRPLMRKIDSIAKIDMSDDEYLLSDLEGREADVEVEEIIESDESLNDLLNDLDNL